mmetsp:Transcript_40266/g.97192  ORF Transcript_40266/g.97192 Transcript_40266/m.97192 type:complete len:414 (+) Transcript_40266:122-1363(+)
MSFLGRNKRTPPVFSMMMSKSLLVSGGHYNKKQKRSYFSRRLVFLLIAFMIQSMLFYSVYGLRALSLLPFSTSGQTKSLLGILLVGKSDVYTLQDWLHRHVGLFEKLVVIDGSENEWVRDLVQNYDDDTTNKNNGRVDMMKDAAVPQQQQPQRRRRIYWLSEASLNLTVVTDQSLRAPAMSILGDPVGKWIMICHADEFWVMDPRPLIDSALSRNQKVNLIRVSTLTASPLESTYHKTVQLLEEEPALLYNGSFHIQQVCNWAHHPKAPFGKFTMANGENRLVQWQEGMRWGTHKHSLVVPELFDDYVPGRIGFYVHFKMHDFSKTAMRGDGYRFANSKLRTGLHNESNTEGWMGQFLDVSFPEALKSFPPRPLEVAIQQHCKDRQFRSMCSSSLLLPWNVEAKFTSSGQDIR